MKGPRRIVCLTEETTETLYLLGEDARIVGISGYTVRPAEARRTKPRVSAFTHANLPKILALRPDLVLAFSDLQAEIVSDLARAGLEVHVFNQRDVAGILAMIRTLGGLVGVRRRAESLAAALGRRVREAARRSRAYARRPRVYFEEWDDPMISGIGWVSELIAAAGGADCFADRARGVCARERFVTVEEVVARDPEIVLASWCGKKFRPDAFVARPGFATLTAVRRGALYEISSSVILQPGPAALTDGLDRLEAIIGRALEANPEP
jgi:iron complex transport system substrate-binding protein